MRVETALEITDDIFRDYDSELIPSKLEQLVSALKLSANQPSEHHQMMVVEARTKLYESLEISRFNDYPPSLELALSELGVREWLGLALKQKLEAAFEGNDITPAAVAQKVEEIEKKVRRLSNQAEQFNISADTFRLYKDKNQFDDYDFTVIVPRNFVSNELDEFGAELKKLDRIFGVFTEISTGSRENFKIKTISSTDLSIVLESPAATALVIATALERIAAFYEKILNIIVLQRQVFSQDRMPKAVKDGLEEHLESEKKVGIESILEDLEREFLNVEDEGRRNELKNELRSSLNEIAKRFDAGFLFDIKGGAPEEPVDQRRRSGKQIEIRRYERINAARQTIRKFKAQSEPLLRLEKPANDDEA